MLMPSFHLSYAAGRHLPPRLPQEAHPRQPTATSAFDNGDVNGYVDGDLYGHLCARADHPDHHVHRDGAPVYGPHPHALAHGTPPKHGTQEEVQFSTRGAGRLTSGCCCFGDDGVLFFCTLLFVLLSSSLLFMQEWVRDPASRGIQHLHDEHDDYHEHSGELEYRD